MEKIKQDILKISITGPESTGKSTLSQALAEHYHTNWVPEFAREYVDKLNRPYNYEDLHIIAKRQLELENELIKYTNKFLFCDTDFLVLKIWSEHKFGKVHPFINDQFNKKTFDLILLMDIDLPWQYDPQREHPNQRKFFLDWYLNELQKAKANFKIVGGSAEDRMINAINIIETEFQ